MADQHHLHAETKTYPVKEHLDLLCKQFLVSALRPAHPSHRCVTSDSGPRAGRRVHTLQSKFLPSVQHLLSDGITPADHYRSILGRLHTSAIANRISTIQPSKLLHCAPPEINSEEERLPRHHRAILSQLRSKYCSKMMDYQKRTGQSTTDLCPECGLVPHTVQHLFECHCHPTQLVPMDLWRRPVAVVSLLCRMSAFRELPPLEPLVPPPPPEPPPDGNGPDPD